MREGHTRWSSQPTSPAVHLLCVLQHTFSLAGKHFGDFAWAVFQLQRLHLEAGLLLLPTLHIGAFSALVFSDLLGRSLYKQSLKQGLVRPLVTPELSALPGNRRMSDRWMEAAVLPGKGLVSASPGRR